MIYKCDCGKEFYKPNSFNGHKSHCKIHAVKIGNLSSIIESEAKRHEKFRETYQNTKEERSKNKLIEKQQELEKWLSEQHTCERCGKVMVEKFGSGRFCCKSCANSKIHSEETRRKISESVKRSETKNKTSENVHERCIAEYNLNPNRCVTCGAILSYENRGRKTCSKECETQLHRKISRDAAERKGGNLNPNPNRNCITGNYKGFHYDSSWELAFIIYHLDNHIEFKRNKKGFPYILNGVEHKYYPDFIKDGIYYEIKNFDSDLVQIKANQFPKELVLRILYKEDIKPYLDYCIKVYGNKFWEV